MKTQVNQFTMRFQSWISDNLVIEIDLLTEKGSGIFALNNKSQSDVVSLLRFASFG